MHRKPLRLLGLSLFVGLLIAGCATPKFHVPELVENSKVLENGQPSHITVQHVLIGFQGSVKGKDIQRTRAEAELLALDLLKRAESGENFGKLVRDYTDDSPPGIYHLANVGQSADMTSPTPDENVFPRSGMVPAFGDVGFPLRVGEVGLSTYDPERSPYGWHIIKRLR